MNLTVLDLLIFLVGINNRNLSTFEVDLETTKIIAEKITHRLLVSESGIKTKSDINQIVSYDVRNFLVGESFMRAKDPGEELKKLFFLIQNYDKKYLTRRHAWQNLIF